MNATQLPPADSQACAVKHTPCSYKQVMRELPRLHAFLVRINDYSGSRVRLSVWSFIADYLATQEGQRALREFDFDRAVKVPYDCLETDLAAPHMDSSEERHCYLDRAVFFWETYFVASLQHSYHPANKSMAA